MRTVILIAALALSACASPPKSAPMADPPAPLAPDARICAPIEPEPPVAGGIVEPVSEAAREAVARFLDAEFDARSWGRRGWTRADVAKDQYCK